MKDGRTLLGEGYFNPIWRDLDTRLALLEEKKATFDAAVQALTEVGLVRINEVLAPSMSGLDEALAEVAAARVALAEALADAAAVFGEIVSRTVLDDALTTLQTGVNAQLTTLQTGVNAQLTTLQTGVNAQLTTLQTGVNAQLTTLQTGVDAQLETVYALAVAAL